METDEQAAPGPPAVTKFLGFDTREALMQTLDRYTQSNAATKTIAITTTTAVAIEEQQW